MTTAPPEDRSAPVEASWLVRLRWAQIAALFATVAGVRFMLHAPFPLAPLFVVVGTLSAANVLLARSLRRRQGALSEGAIAAHLLLDALGLTVLLSFTGGAMNPFTILYVLHVALGAILAGRRWGLVVTVLVIVAFGALLVVRPEQVHVWHSASMFGLHVRGMWLGFALTAGALWFFIDRVVGSLRAREIELAAARLDAERAVRWTALGTLAAGTAHELNTPLGTIAILASELAETLDRSSEQARRRSASARRCGAAGRSSRACAPTPPTPRSPPWWRCPPSCARWWTSGAPPTPKTPCGSWPTRPARRPSRGRGSTARCSTCSTTPRSRSGPRGRARPSSCAPRAGAARWSSR
jgi:hypothetical protein